MADAGRVRAAERTFVRTLLRLYPRDFVADYAPEMELLALRLLAGARTRGGAASVLAWLHLVVDAVRSAPVAWWRRRRAWQLAWSARRATRAPQSAAAPAPDWSGAAVAGVVVLVLYVATLAPTAAFWDAGEYITAAHVLGIPHPPGNPLFVMLSRTWELLLSPFGWTTAVRVNLLSAACSALAHGFLFLSVERAFRGLAGPAVRRVSAACAVVLSATAFTVWSQSNVNEKVYTVSFLTVLASVWLLLRWRDTRDAGLLIMLAYITALTAANHLMGVLVAPAALLFVWRVDRRPLLRPRLWAAALPAVMIAASAHFFLPLRAAQQPLVNESDPACASLSSAAASIYTNGAAGCAALSATLRREQYGKPSVLRDPNAPHQPRGVHLIASQFINYAQYVDWQWARSVAGDRPVFGGARPVLTLLVLLLMAAGARAHWRADRNAALLHATLLVTLSIGLVLYLNFRYGYTLERVRFPAADMHEVRERDYFFLISFSLIGAWAGIGLAAAWQVAARLMDDFLRTAGTAVLRREGVALRLPAVAAAPVLLLALVPAALNAPWADRAHDWTARDWAYNVLMSVEPYGVLVTNGDNDSFPLWYVQHVERVREDVTIVVGPYIATDWYARQVRDLSRPCPHGVDPTAQPTRIVCQRPFRPDGVHPRLLAAWGGVPAAPLDSVLPLSDDEIAGIAAGYYVTDEALELVVNGLRGRVAAGSFISPVDTFVAAILHSSYGVRPIHFMAPSETVAKLGLVPHTVRVGLTWKLDHRRVRAGTVELPVELRASALGAAVDLPVTDTLARDVFIVRGRVADPDLPWVDHATWSIPLQYASMNYAAAIAHELRGQSAAAAGYLADVEFWHRFVGDMQ